MDSDRTLFHYSLFLISPPTWISLYFLQAPYGKHNRSHHLSSSGLVLHGKPHPLAHSPALPLRPTFFQPKSLILIYPFLLHYFNRTVLYPLRLSRNGNGEGFPVSIALTAFGFNLLNAYLQARWVSHYKDDYERDGLFWWKFLCGLLIYGDGMWVNIWADEVLVGLKNRAAADIRFRVEGCSSW
ncbi:Steroid 5-alpha-reductase DET2 [Hibiscus syriacus]|uniref:Steroid 5-alpha-reductase DET2 n=1 Tax=Hibiscus syriacus TaxID=106335 RepID=A0A6A2ZNF3_HIBSY|nr:Steroid 5-alpha-reductase DET2 [Hibiscus syriacus]